MKKLIKLIKRKKYRLILTPVIAIALIVVAITSYKKTFASMSYNLLTDSNGIKWQYGYDPSTQVLEVAFYSTTGSPQTITVPNKTYFINNGTGITNGVTTYKIVNYEYHGYSTPSTFTSSVRKLDLSAVDVVNGVNPIVSTTIETEIVLNPNGSEIGLDAFRNRKIDIKNLDKVTKILGGAFYNVTFTDPSIKLPNLTQMGDGTFENSNIMHLEINSPTVGISAFKNCTSLATVKFGNNVTTLSAGSFEGDINLEKVDFNKVTTLVSDVFKYCSSFNQDLKDTKITSIGPGSFWGTTGFTQPITMPDGVTSLSWKTFQGSNIKSVNLNNVKTIGNDVFRECNELIDINFGKVESIGYRAFSLAKKLTNVNLSDSVKLISEEAFANCNIQNVNLNKVNSIQYRAFYNNNIEEIYFPKSITELSTYIFEKNSIQKVTIAYDTTIVYNMLFVIIGQNDNYKIKEVELIAPYKSSDTLPSTSRTYSAGTEHGDDTNSSIGNAMSYKNVLKGLTLFNLPGLEKVTIGEGYEFIGSMQISHTTPNVKEVVLPSTLKGIGSWAFSNGFNAENNVQMNLPDSIEYIGPFAFSQSYGFKNEIDIKNLKYIGDGAFEFSGITKIVFNSKLQRVKSVATTDPTVASSASIYHCMNLKTIIIDCDLFSMTGASAMYNMFGNDYTTSYIHNHYDLIKITEKAVTPPNISSFFWGIQAKKVDLGDAPYSTLGYMAFQSAKIDELILPKNLKKIEDNTFFKAYINTPLELPDSITHIKMNAFMASGVNIKDGHLPNSLTTIGSNAFYDCKIGDNIVIPASVTSIGQMAFATYTYTQADTMFDPVAQDGGLSGYMNGEIYRKSITFLNSMSKSVYNGKIGDLLLNTRTDELIFGNNVTELPTNTTNNDRTYNDSEPEFINVNVRKVTFKNLRKLPNKAFIGNSNLEEVDFSKDSNLTEIGAYAFMYNRKLKKVKLYSGSNITVKFQAFCNSGLESIGPEDSGLDLVNNKITVPDMCTFQSCTSLRYVELNKNFNNGVIPNGSFDNCYMIETAILHDDITRIEQNAFNVNSYNYNIYDTSQALVMYGNTEIVSPANNTTLTLSGYSPIYIELENYSLKNTYTNWSLNVKTYSSSSSYSTYTFNSSNTYTQTFYPASSSYNTVFTINDPLGIISLKKSGRYVYISLTDPSTGSMNLYCYSNNTNCINYYQRNETYYNSKTGYAYNNKTGLYYLDEIVHIDTNKKNVDMNANNTDIDKTGLILYALRRDGVLLVSNEYGRYKEAVKYAESDITLPSYHPTLEDPARRVFNTNKDISSLNVRNSENFANVTYHMGEEDPETGRIYVSIEYPNIVGSNSLATNILKTKGNYADIVYSDGCNGESFGIYSYENVLIGDLTPEFGASIPVRPGYEFMGWNQEISDIATGDIVYVAQWRKIEEPEEEEDDIDDPIPAPIINPQTGRSLLILTPFILLIIGGYIIKKKRKIIKSSI